MSTLLLRLAGPMQSWGTQSRFSIRETGLEPSKSGVIGLLCAALGRPRTEPVDDLVALRMGVRVDHEGTVKMDYHTAGGSHRRGDSYGVARVDGSRVTVPSNRYYLADASFLVGLEGDEALLRQIDHALAQPVWQISLGRKAFVPGEPVRLPDEGQLGPGLRPDTLVPALRSYPWPHRSTEPLRFVLDASPVSDGEVVEVRADVPLSFAPGNRSYAIRYVATRFWLPMTEVTA